SADQQVWNIEGLRVNLAVYSPREQLAKRVHVHVRSIQGGLEKILAGAAGVVLMCDHCNLPCTRADQQRCHRANSGPLAEFYVQLPLQRPGVLTSLLT